MGKPCVGVEYFVDFRSPNASKNYKPKDCILASSTNTKNCPHTKWNMILWEKVINKKKQKIFDMEIENDQSS
jgi:hypothetical protein